MRLSKAERAALHAKFGGRCAYCGEPLGERWHADHIEAVERKLEFVRDGSRTRLRTTGEVHRPERDCITNLNPACAPCNIDKHAMSLESWRQKLANAPGVLSRNQPTYRHARRFGLVLETGASVTFYFERASASDGWRTSPDGLTRTKIAPDAAAPMVPSPSVTLRMGDDGRLHPVDGGGVKTPDGEQR